MKSNISKYRKTYKKVRAEQKQYLKQKRKTYKKLTDSTNCKEDSLKNTLSKKIRQEIRRRQQAYFVYKDILYKAEGMISWDNLTQQSKNETLAYSKNILDGSTTYQKYQSQTNQLAGYYSEFKEFKDSLKETEEDKYERAYPLEKKKAELADKYNHDLEERLTQEMQQRELIPTSLTSPELEELQQFDDLASNLNPNELPADINTHGLENLKKGDVLDAAKTQGMDYFSGKEELLEDGVENLQGLKKKYSSVPNSNDLSTATKSSSLKGKRLKQRFVIRGNFQIHIDQQIAIDLNPDIGFLINKDFSIGAGGNYRLNAETLKIAKATEQVSTYGYRFYMEHKVFSSFYIHVEYENLIVSIPDPVTTELSKSWNTSILAGLEKRIRVSDQVEGQVSFLYNFMYKNNPAYSSPLVIRVGFNYTGLLDN